MATAVMYALDTGLDIYPAVVEDCSREESQSFGTFGVAGNTVLLGTEECRVFGLHAANVDVLQELRGETMTRRGVTQGVDLSGHSFLFAPLLGTTTQVGTIWKQD